LTFEQNDIHLAHGSEYNFVQVNKFTHLVNIIFFQSQ